MTRKNRRRDDFAPVPEREARSGHRNVLKVVRLVSEDDSRAINGAIANLALDNTIPMLRKPVYRHSLFVLDPRLVRPEFNRGFKMGFESAKAKLEKTGRGISDSVVAPIGDICLRKSGRDGADRELFLPIMSEEITNERIGYYETLAINGVKGLEDKIKKPGSLDLYLGQLDIPKVVDKADHDKQPRPEREEIIEAITTAFVIHGIEKVTLGASFVPGPRGQYPVE